MSSNSASPNTPLSILRLSSSYSPSPSPYFKRDESFRHKNSEDIHRELLAAAQLEHRRIREIALRAFQVNEERIAQLKLQERVLLEEESLRLEIQRIESQSRLRESQEKARQVALVPPPLAQPTTTLTPTPEPQPKPSSPKSIPLPSQPTVTPAPLTEAKPHPPAPISDTPPTNGTANARSEGASQAAPHVSDLESPVHQSTQAVAPSASPLSSSGTHPLFHVERYTEIHKALKELRLFVCPKNVPEEQDKLALKQKAGEVRRTIKMSVGQLTNEKNANIIPTTKIRNILREALNGYPSPGIDPNTILIAPKTPQHNDPNEKVTLPCLYIYALNILAKAVVSQFVNECSLGIEKSDPIGILAASIFAQAEFCWRGTSLISILMAKMRIVCPVLFGIRGNEKTHQGRLRLGWGRANDSKGQKTNGWITETEHNTQMAGLGSGYASIALRDFARSKMTNPYPAINYWMSMASITSTPPEEMSSTQFVVLKAMISGYEQKFFNLYGSAAKAALYVSLVDFPNRWSGEPNASVTSLKFVRDTLIKDHGLDLER